MNFISFHKLPSTCRRYTAGTGRNLWRFFSDKSRFSEPPTDTVSEKPPKPNDRLVSPKSPPIFSPNDFSVLRHLLSNPSLSPSPSSASSSSLQIALERTGIQPDSSLLLALFRHFSSSPKLLHSLFLWAEKQSGFQCSETLFNSMVNVLAKSGKFHSAWELILRRLGSDGSDLVSCDTFVIMIRWYALAGMPQPAIRTLEYASNLSTIHHSESKRSLFKILLDSFCNEGLLDVAEQYVDRKKRMDLGWVPSIEVYNTLLNGWFQSKEHQRAEKLRVYMKRENVKPSIETYGILAEGYCRLGRVERAIELLNQMKQEGIKPNGLVYNPIIDALGEAGRFKDALGMMERFLVCESGSGPTLFTYNSLVKSFCKAGDVVGASKMLKMMTSRGVSPTTTTYNYFFKLFANSMKSEEAIRLYTKMVESGYSPDRLTFHLMIMMFCAEERLDLAVQFAKEMRSWGFDLDLATNSMFVQFLCNMHRLDEAFAEFQCMIQRGLVPEYHIFQRLNDDLKKQGMAELAKKLRDSMASVPNPCRRDGEEDASHRRTSIIWKAKAMSDILKTCNDPQKLVKHTSLHENDVANANWLIQDIVRRANLEHHDCGR